MTYIELGKKVLEQAGKPLSVKEIFEKACEMGLDKECNDGKILSHSVLEVSLVSTALKRKTSNSMLHAKKEKPFSIGSNLVKENFLHKKPQTPKMMNRASVQAQPKNKKTLFMKSIYTDCL